MDLVLFTLLMATNTKVTGFKTKSKARANSHMQTALHAKAISSKTTFMDTAA